MTLKGYKHTELGVLPEDWEVVRLGDVCEIRDGTHESPKPTNEGKILITSKNLKGGKIDFLDSYHISLEDFGAINKRSKVEKYDILMSMIGTVGEVAFVDIEPNFAIKNVALFKMDGNEKFSKFLFFFFQSSIGKKRILSFLSGSTQKYITLDFLRNLKIPLPPLAEQEKIAEILSAWDTQIQNFETLITEKQALKKGLCQTLLTAKIRLKGFSEDWEVVRLGDVAHYKNGETLEDFIDPKGSFFLITLDSIDIKGKLKTNHKRIEISHNNTLKKGDIVMILSDIAHGNFLGLTGVISQDNLYVLNQRVGALKVDNKRANSIFLSLLINANQKYFKRMGQGTSQQNLRKGDIEKFIFSLPPLAEQEKIAEILGEGDKEIMLLEQKLESLKSQKRGLMQKLLGGKIRINFKG